MSKKRKGALLLTSALLFGGLAASALVGCADQAELTPDVTVAISISNKEALTAAWQVNEPSREISVSLVYSDGSTKSPQQAFLDGDYTVTSSDPSVIAVAGRGISAVADGTATITVAAAARLGGASDSVTITVTGPQVVEGAMTVAEVYEAASSAQVTVIGQVVQISRDGFFIGDSTGYVYVYTALGDGLELGDTVVVTGTRGAYSGVAQISNATSVAAHSSQAIDLDVEYVKIDETNVNSIDTSKINPIEIDLTLIYRNGDRWYWDAKGADVGTAFYSGYLADDPSDDSVNATYHMTGFVQGQGSDSSVGASKRINFYPSTFEKINNPAITAVTLTAERTEIWQKETVALSYTITEDPAWAECTVVSSNTEVATVSGNYHEGFSVTGVSAGTTTLTITAAEGVTAILEITVTDDVYEAVSIKSIYDQISAGTLDSDSSVYFYGKLMGNVGTRDTHYYVGDGEHVMYVYNAASVYEGAKVGDTVEVRGGWTIYNGLLEITNATITQGSTGNSPVAPSVTSLTSLASVNGTWTGRPVEVKGTVASVSVNSSDNVTMVVNINSTETVTLYGDSRYESETVLDTLGAMEVGAEVTAYGNVSYYVSGGNTLPADATGMQIISLSLEAAAEPEPVPTPDYTLVEKGYLGLWQANRGEALYYAGKMSGFYLATTTSIGDAAEVSVYEYDGGVALYVSGAGFDHSGKWIGAVLNDGHRNFDLSDTPYKWTYSEEYDTYLTTLGEDECYFGTYNNYNTLSISTTSHISTSYPIHLVQEAIPNPNPTPEPDPTPTEGGVTLDLSVNTLGFKTSYKGSEEKTYGDGVIRITNGAYIDDYKGIVIGSNKKDNFTGLVPSYLLSAVVSGQTTDANLIDGVYYAALEFDFSVANCNSFTFAIPEDRTLQNTATLYVLRSTDGGATYSSVASMTNSSMTSKTYTYTEETASSNYRYALLVADTGNGTTRNPITSVTFGQAA